MADNHEDIRHAKGAAVPHTLVEDEKIILLLQSAVRHATVDLDRWAQTFGRTADEIVGLQREAERRNGGGEHEGTGAHD